MIESFWLRNFRSVRDAHIKLKPVTVLVGKNGSGKSSVSRVLPLLKQSLAVATRGPILWSGTEVDLGNIDASMGPDQSASIRLGFSFLYEKGFEYAHESDKPYGPKSVLTLSDDKANRIDVEICLCRQDSGFTRIAEARFQFEGINVRLILDTEGNGVDLYMDGQPVNHLLKGRSVTFNQESIIGSVESWVHQTIKRKGKQDIKVKYRAPSDSEVRRILRKHIDPRVSDKKVREISSELPLSPKEELLEEFETLDFGIKAWKKFCQELSTNGSLLDSLHQALAMKILPGVAALVASTFRETIQKVRYNAPIRASAQRYYRLQDLSISQVDSNGTNLPIFLDSLGDAHQADFRAWLDEWMGYKVKTRRIEGHLVLEISDENGDYVNIADSGSGFAQITPLAAQLWDLAIRDIDSVFGSTGQFILVMEQPELHLHPALQYKFGRLLVGCVKEAKRRKKDIRILVETHSKELIEALGVAVEQREMYARDVSILLFDRIDNVTSIKESVFTKDGILKDWPFGFFEPDL